MRIHWHMTRSVKGKKNQATAKIIMAGLGLLIMAGPLSGATRVAVYDVVADGGTSYQQNAIVQALKAQPDFQVELIPDLALERLLKYDVLVLPVGSGGMDVIYAGGGKAGGSQMTTTVPSFIEAGGGVLDCYGHVGGGYPPAKENTLYPSVASLAGEYRFFKKKSPAFKSVGDHPVSAGIDELRASVPPKGNDWMKDNGTLMKCERNGQIVFADPEIPYFGIVIAGDYGGGRVVISGLLFGSLVTNTATKDEIVEKELLGKELKVKEAIVIDEQKTRLLVNSVKWLATPSAADKSREYAVVRLAEVEALVNGRTQKIQKHVAELKQAEAEAGKRNTDLTALKDQIAKASALASEQIGSFGEGIKSAKTKMDAALKKPSREGFADLFLGLNTLAGRLNADSVATILAVDEAANETMRKSNIKFSRAMPKYPRFMFHVLMHVRMGEPSDVVMDKYLRELAEELHCNGEAGLVEDVRSPGQWFADEKVMSRYLAYCQAHGLKWFAFTTNPMGTGLETNGAVELYARSPAFAGLFLDEPIYLFGRGNYSMQYPDMDAHFREFLKKNYSTEELKKLLINPDTIQLSKFDDSALLKDPSKGAVNPELDKVLDPVVDRAARDDYQKALWMVTGEFFRDEMRSTMEKPIGLMKKIDPDLTAWINLNISPAYSFGQSVTASGDIADVVGFDPYNSGAIAECVMMEMARGGGVGKKIWGIAFGGGKYTWNQSLYRRHLYNLVLHADGVAIFAWSGIYKHQHGWSDGRPGWSPGFWEQTADVFKNVEKVEDYLCDRQSMAKVALLMSERTMWGNYFVPWGGKGQGTRYFSTIVALYAALQQSHVPTDIIFAEKFSKLNLSKYAVLICPTAGCLEDAEMAALREWVKAGGVLLATSRTSGNDRYGRQRQDYALSDMFRASYQETKADKDIMKVLNSPLSIQATNLEYNADERDVLKALSGGTVIGQWSDGSTAAVLADYGKGACIFAGTTFLGLGYDGLGSARHWPARFRFKPGVREFLDGCVNWGLKRQGLDSAVVLDKDLLDLMVDVRTQKTAEGQERLIVQFLDYGDVYTLDPTKAKSVPFKTGVPDDCYVAHPHKAITLKVRLPEGWAPDKVKAMNPLTGKELAGKADGKYFSLNIDQFVLYNIIVLEAGK
ncbi:MAG: beta-galactosidase trimerization domain-containing protein [Kiritimatiellae bacterium]|nr:beta-galactosidase trimerization domain-containing protein [Verrucomicrobiota bacterium]MBU4291746.1 beta-galactosidase trimerization domain-containing protein [Verrucomicrobiota bacterium]MCG2679336.1 beta-galactosidase trimerization domain-containing protein [Kiritimatiellia bacterium]